MSDEPVDWLTGTSRRSAARHRIRTAATELFLERGLDRVSVEEVAVRAGCSRATLYRHVGGKDALIDIVLAQAAATVAQRVIHAIEPFSGTRRIVEAIVQSVQAIRADPALSQWFTTIRNGVSDEYLATTPELGHIATVLTQTVPDNETARWIVRVVLSLLAWPLPNAAAERRLVERFVAPAFAGAE